MYAVLMFLNRRVNELGGESDRSGVGTTRVSRRTVQKLAADVTRRAAKWYGSEQLFGGEPALLKRRVITNKVMKK